MASHHRSLHLQKRRLAVVIATSLTSSTFFPILQAQQLRYLPFQSTPAAQISARVGPDAPAVQVLESESAVQDVSAQSSWWDDLFAKGSPLYFGLAVGETYDDNIFISPDKTSSFITHISPSIDFQKGDLTSPHMHYLNIFFAPTIYLYQNHANDDRIDYNADLYYQYAWTRLTLGIEQNYQHLTDSSLDIGRLVPRDIYTTTINGNYVFNDDLTLFGTATQKISSFPDVAANEWDIDSYALYQVAPKLSLGAGPRFTFLDLSGAPNETHQDLLVRLKYVPGSKVSVSFDGGAEYLQYQDNSPTHVVPVFDLNFDYAPRDGTNLYLTADRATFNSFDFQGQTIVNTAVQAGVNQRFLQDFSFTLSGGYSMANYEFGSVTNGDGEGRRDNFYFAKAGAEWDPKPWLKVEMSYQWSENDSNFVENAFNDNQVNIQTSVHF